MTISTARRALLGAAAALTCGTLTGPALADDYPSKPVRVVVPFAAGNTLDLALRLVGEEFRKETGQNLIVEAKPGGGGVVAAQTVQTSKPDGYTVLLGSVSMMAANPHLYPNLPYKPLVDFRPVTNFLGARLVLAVNSAAVPSKTLPEFVSWVKANPGKVSFASFTAGNSSHLSGLLLNERAGLDMTHVPHNGTPPAVQSLLGGHVQAAFLPLLAVKPQVATGKVHVLANTGAERSTQMPDVPTFKELGYGDLEIYIWSSLLVPAGTPDAIVNRLNALMVKALRSKSVTDKFTEWDFVAMPSTPAETGQYITAESQVWGKWSKLMQADMKTTSN
ncbi:MAG: Bug family tripartite tricarboxylate transporter substrate binding protein [Burkholderiaceae bacterium]